jgi:hypothetical protein
LRQILILALRVRRLRRLFCSRGRWRVVAQAHGRRAGYRADPVDRSASMEQQIKQPA